MEHGQQQGGHREYEESLGAAVLGVLEPDEHKRLRDHLVTCASCRASLGNLFSVVDVLPEAVEEREPSAALREKLRAQVVQSVHERRDMSSKAQRASQSRVAPLPAPDERHLASDDRSGKVSRFPASWILAVAAMLLIGLIGGVAAERWLLNEESDETGAESIALDYPADIRAEDASLTYLPDQQLLHFQSHDLPAPPEGEVYQVWLIDEGSDPKPVGVVDQDTGEFATTLDVQRYDTFAITIEPSPLGSPGPTSDPVVVAPLGTVSQQ